MEKDNRFKISWSALQKFEQCKQLAYLVRTGHSSPTQNVRNFLAGNIVDSIQRTWLENPSGKMVDMVDEHMAKAIEKSEESGTIIWRNAQDKSEINKFCKEVAVDLQPILEARVLTMDYQPAVRFYEPVKIRHPDGHTVEIVLRGEFDLLLQNPATERYQVWDLKTTKDNDYWKKTLGQLLFYDLVIISMFGKPPEKTGLIQPACNEQIKEFTFTNDDRAQMWGRIAAMVAAEWNEDYAPKKDNEGCAWCVVKHACSKTKRKLTFGKAVS